MSFSFREKIDNSFWLVCAAALLFLIGCESEKVREEKALRKELVREMRSHSYESVAPLARRLVQLKPHDNVAWKRLVQSEIRLHDLDGARQTLAQWRKSAQSSLPRMEECEGDIAHDERNLSGALVAWQKAAAAQPRRHRVFEKIAALEQGQQDWKKATEAWTAALKAKGTPLGLINRAVCQRRLHHWTEAIEDLHHAQKLGPDEPDVQRWSKLFETVGKFLEQVRELDAKVEALPTDVGLLGDRALLMLRCGDPEMALDDCETALRIAPWAVRPKLFKGIALIALRRGAECEKMSIRQPLKLEMLSPDFLETMSRIDSAISVEPKNADHFAMRAWQLNEIGQPGLALQDGETAARLNPRSGSAIAEIGYALTKLGRADEGFEEVKLATELDPALASAWQYRGELEMQRGNNLAAIESLTHALNIQQTVAGLQKREECYRRAGLIARAEEDRRALQQLGGR